MVSELQQGITYIANALRINDKIWETYGDMKVKVDNTNISVKTTVYYSIL